MSARRDQHRDDVAQPPHKIIAKFPAVVVFDEAQQAPMPDASNDEVYAYTVHSLSVVKRHYAKFTSFRSEARRRFN